MMEIQFTAIVVVPDEIIVPDRAKLFEQIESILSFYYGYTKITDYEERVADHEITDRH